MLPGYSNYSNITSIFKNYLYFYALRRLKRTTSVLAESLPILLLSSLERVLLSGKRKIIHHILK